MTPKLMAVALAATSVLMASPALSQAPDSQWRERLDPVADWYMAAPIVGMTVAVSRDGEEAVEAWGWIDEARTQPARPDTVYEIGSITKTFTAALVLRQVEQGRIGLDDAASRWLPELTDAASGVTVRHLLAHVSGLSSAPASDDLTRPVTGAELFAVLASRPREFEPGTRHRYNNNGYLLLGLILERATGMPYADLLERELLVPLGLTETRPCRREDAARPFGFDHAYREAPRPVPHPRHHPEASGAAGLLCSTAGDVLRWQSALMGGKAIGREMLDRMLEPQTLADGSTSPYGLGIYVDEGRTRLHHGGAASGFITQMAWRPEDRVGVVVLTNGIYSGALVERLESDLASAVVGAWTAPLDAPAEEAELRALEGVYRVGPTRLDVFMMDGHLRARPEGQVATRLLNQGGGVYRAEHDPELTLAFDGDGGLLLAKGGRALPPGRRTPE